MKFIRTWKTKSDGGGQQTHLAGTSDYTLCGLDAVGDDMVHAKDPQVLEGENHRVTCDHCLETIEISREYLNRKPTKSNKI